MHAERLDAVLPQNLLLPAIHIPQPDIHQLPQTQHASAPFLAPAALPPDPPEHLLLLPPRQARQERDRHPVDIPAPAALRRVDIRVRIHPDDGHVAAQALADGAAGAGDGADGDGVVAAEGEDEAARGGVLVDLVGEGLGDGGDGARVLHRAVRGVGRGEEGGVVVHGVVVVQGVAEVGGELGEEAGGDEGGGGGFDAGFTLGGGAGGLVWVGGGVVVGGGGRRKEVPARRRSRPLPRRAHWVWRGTFGGLWREKSW